MAKRKTKTRKTTTKGKRTKGKRNAKAGADSGEHPRLPLVGTQREALKAFATKRDLAAVAVKLANQHGTTEQQALKRAEIEARKRDEIEALVEDLAGRAQQRRRVHLSELGGWPVCWTEERRGAVKAPELLTTPITVNADAVSCTRCKQAAELPSPEETAALKRAEAEAEQPAKAKRVKKGETKSGRDKRQLKLKKNLPVRLKLKDLEVKGVLRPDGTMSVKGTSYASPHAAANELAGELVSYRIDGFQAWRYQDDDGKWRMLRDHG